VCAQASQKLTREPS